MLDTFRSVIRSTRQRARDNRDYRTLLQLDDHLLRDIGVGRDEVRARMSR
jgi:uncharacterized protein YjiS (DUF1127 family)